MREEKKRDGTRKTLGGSEERRGLHIQGSPSLGGAQLGQKERLILCGKRTRQKSVAAGQSETCTQGTDASPAQPSLRGYLLLHQRLGAEMWGLESRPRQKNAVGCEEAS